MKTVDGGAIWEEQISGLGFGSSINLRGVQSFDGRHVWVVGDVGTVLRSLDGGVTFELLELPSPYKQSDLYDVHFKDPSRGWVVGSLNGTILYSGVSHGHGRHIRILNARENVRATDQNAETTLIPHPNLYSLFPSRT